MSKWRENLLEKLVALVVAVVLTLYVQAQLHPIVEKQVPDVPIEIMNRPSGYDVSLPDVNTVEVTVRGVKDQVERINPAQIRAMVDLSNARPGMNRLPVGLRYPKEWQPLVDIYPDRLVVPVMLQQRATRRLPVQVEWVGTPGSKEVVPDATVEPNTISISGPAEQVRKVREVVVSFDLTNLQGDFEMDMNPVARDETGKPMTGVQLKPSEVLVRVRLIPQPSSKTVPVSLRWSSLPPFPYRVIGYSVEPAQVRLLGDPSQLVQLNVVETEPISLANRRADSVLMVPLQVPPGIRVEGTPRVRVQVRIHAEVEEHPPNRGTNPSRTGGEERNIP